MLIARDIRIKYPWLLEEMIISMNTLEFLKLSKLINEMAVERMQFK